MATSIPKAVPKSVPKSVQPAAEAAAEAPPAKKSRKKLFLILGILVLALAGGGAAWYFLVHKPGTADPAVAAQRRAVPPVFVTLDPFTVNLQPENGEQYLQVAFTLQVAGQPDVDRIKVYMPQVRSRVLLMLSNKQASELLTLDGKQKLSEEIVAKINEPFYPEGVPLEVSNVFFTSFVIQ